MLKLIIQRVLSLITYSRLNDGNDIVMFIFELFSGILSFHGHEMEGML